MTPSPLARWSTLLAVAPLLAGSPRLPGHHGTAPRPTTVRVTLATLHAAALTSPRRSADSRSADSRSADSHSADSVDRPFLLVSVIGPRTHSATLRLPSTGALRIRHDEALGARPLVDLSLTPGDTVRLLVTALEGTTARDAADGAAAASARALRAPRATWERGVASALAPVTGSGARWLGSATLLLVDDGGTLYWRALECVAACNVLSGAAAVPFPPPDAKPLAGVVELSGAGGTYHMQLRAQRAP